MAIYFQGKKISRMGALTEPSTYDADITPENMQHGMTAYAQGKKVVGTGKCFEYAVYGARQLQSLKDEDGNNRYGFSIYAVTEPNIIFLASTENGDIVLQSSHIVDLADNAVAVVGINHTSSGEVTASYSDNRLKIILGNTENQSTRLRYFFGKDNMI